MDESKPGTSIEIIDEINTENELTNKFLSGEMSFADYSTEWFDYEDEDDVETNRRIVDESRQSNLIAEKGVIRRRKATRLTPALLGLMGEANLRFARGDKETAERMCQEIIKQIPTSAEPYQTLAQIYENDPEKSLQFSLLAAHLSPSDPNEWLRLAAISKERGDIKQEMMCYTQAIKADPHNLEIHLKRLQVLDYLEEAKYPLNSFNVSHVKCYHKIATSLPASEADTVMKYARLGVTIYHNSNEIERALDLMGAVYKKCPAAFNIEDLNILLELLISRKQYQTCLEVFVASAGVTIEAEIQTVKNSKGDIEEQTNYIKCCMPNDLQIDLKSKLLICFIYLGATDLIPSLLNDFLSNEVEKAGDLYMDIEEALTAMGYHDLAMQLLEPLVKNTSFDLGAVWLKHADCLHNLGQDDDAIQSYNKVLTHAPQHPEARKKLYNILLKKGQISEAVNALQQDYRYAISMELLYQQLCVLKEHNKSLKYMEIGQALLCKTFVQFRHPEELAISYSQKNPKNSVEHINNFRSVRGESLYLPNEIHFDEDETFKLTPQQEWELFKELLEIAFKNKKFFTMQRLTAGAITSKSLYPHRAEIEFLCFQSCLLNKDYENAIRLVKEFAQKYPNTRTWNLLGFLVNTVDEGKHARYIIRLFQKDNLAVKNIFLGNNFLTTGRYIVAFKHFLEYHNHNPKEPFSALMVGICLLVMASQRTMSKYQNLILQGMSYLLLYQKLRNCDQEAYYNLGRAYQMLSINNLAIEYYEKALAAGPIAVCSQHGVMDLTRETAYNLYILYKEQSPQMARKYLNKYLVI
ncbi:general transcription factor 3C polypeptide 3 [Amyelois transitella]|uniref:general transcription factor 3C polypeptide 3 n=1 Tax=Amyelois transitella TaxID=680683 RepID=UPI0029907874|nr:general transcription factor 3C polypeptide 3 [Amyelois transitella]